MPQTLAAGTTLQERYVIQARIGGGGLTRVYEAQDLFQHDITQTVAIKEFHPNPALVQTLRAAVLESFRQASGFLMDLNHPAIAKALDFFEIEDRAYLVMGRIDGHGLQALLDDGAKISVSQVVQWGLELCDALIYLHELEPDPFIFCNVTPANIMIDRAGRAHLVDFGLANLFIHRVFSANAGPAGYTAPEFYLGVVNQGIDVYGLGATLHHLLTGCDPRLLPFFSFEERPIREYNPAAPEALEDIIMRALDPLPSARYQNCVELRAALHSL